ncbi:sulfatase [Flavobacterium nackdongense]|nr:sulfatase [Flavobacterium nackdongense]
MILKLHFSMCLIVLFSIGTLAQEKPNVIIILADDQGNADAGFQRSPATLSTPSIDKLAASGVIFSQAYASAYVCAPTRAGLLTGRYQQRFGFYTANDSRVGLPLSETTLADLLQKEGYRTGIFGKWHLGIEESYHPLKRGFMDFYGFLGHGGHDYYNFSCPDEKNYECIQRNFKTVNESGYLTDILAKEACSFIKGNAEKKKPFFLYLPFNAVHAPLQAPEEDIKRFNTGNRNRDIQLAMIYRMDLAIGEVIKTLKEEGIYENTLIFYFSDNGGAKATSANNLPLRDYKQSVYEGGLRVPFVVSWPAQLQPSVCKEPIISLDIMPTICAILDIKLPTNKIFDGKNILPAIDGKLKQPLHEALFWDGAENRWAVRSGQWKLVFDKGAKLELYDLQNDISESRNLAAQNPDKTNELKLKYEKWRAEMKTPMGDFKKKNRKKNK